jgi:hypothetical protein
MEIVRIRSNEGDNLIAIVRMSFCRDCIRPLPIPYAIHAEGARYDVVA